MLTIDIKINGRRIAGAEVKNVSSLADVSDYLVTAVESRSEDTRHLADFGTDFKIEGHPRRQSAWALVFAVAAKVMTQRQAEVRAKTPRQTPKMIRAMLPVWRIE